MSRENEFILRFAIFAFYKNKDFSELEELSRTCNWNYFTKRVIDLAVAPLLYSYLKDNKFPDFIPSKVIRSFEQSFYQVLTLNVLIKEKFRVITEELARKNISYIPLKGILLINQYQNLGIRQISDIDLLFKKSERELVLITFKALKFQVYYNVPKGVARVVNYPSPFKFVSGAIMVDYHEELHYQEHGYFLPINEIWLRSYQRKANAYERYLSSEDFFLFQCLHLEKHLKVMETKLINFFDIMLIIEKTTLDFKIIRDRITSYRCSQEMGIVCFLMDEFFSTDLISLLSLNVSETMKLKLVSMFERILSEDRLVLYSENSIKGATGLSILKHLSFKERIQYLFYRVFPDKDYINSINSENNQATYTQYIYYWGRIVGYLFNNYFRQIFFL